MKPTKLEQAARKMCRHRVVYTSIQDAMILVRAFQGRTTGSIAREYGMTESQVQYAINKEQRRQKHRFRSDARNGKGPLARAIENSTTARGLEYVGKKVVPNWVKYAAADVPRTPVY